MGKQHTKKEIRAAALIREGLEEAVAFVRGKDTGARVLRVPLTARYVAGQEAPVFEKSRIIDLRDRMGLSQTVFAEALNVSPETVRAWEQGKNMPGGPALRLLEIAEEQPEVVLNRVQVKGLMDEGRYHRGMAKPTVTRGSLTWRVTGATPKTIATKRNPIVGQGKAKGFAAAAKTVQSPPKGAKGARKT